MVKEAHAHGFELLNTVSLGPDVIFTRTPVRDLAALRKLKLWRWDLDEVGIATSREMGLQVVPLPVGEAAARLRQTGASTASSPSRWRRSPSSGRRARAT